MTEKPIASLEKHFGSLTDPRVERTREHNLLDIVIITICAVICGAEGWTDVELFGESKEAWFKQFLELPNGIPSHDTFGRVFAKLSAEEFERCFLSWIEAVSHLSQGEIIAIDGKRVRRSHDGPLGKSAIHLVSAWASENRLVLGQRKVDEKSNEITAIPALLKALELAGCIVTIDAMGCQKDIAAQIIQRGGDYVLALKGNQAHLSEDAAALFEWAQRHDFEQLEHDVAQTVNKGHGRIEQRECLTLSDRSGLAILPQLADWPGLNTLVRVRSQRKLNGETSVETRYFISSLKGNTPQLAARLLHIVRAHWGIENQLHWVLDVSFAEDDSRVRVGNAPENLAIMRRIALNLLRLEKSIKVGVHAKRLKAGWDEAYLLKLLAGLAGPSHAPL